MLLQNLHRRYLYITIKLPHLSDLEQRIPDFLNCDNYGSLHPNNPDPLLDDTPTNDNELHQVICNTFKIDYLQEIDIIIKIRNRFECKINYTLPALLPNKIKIMQQGPVTSGEGIRNKSDTRFSNNSRSSSYRQNDDKKDKHFSQCKKSIII